MRRTDINLNNFHKSIGDELNAIKNRVRHLIGDAHWLKEGEYKEAILRNCINKFLPNQYSLGTGFVLIKNANGEELVTSQIDIIVYDNSYPILFREGDFVIVLPQSVRGIIEVKTKITYSKLAKIVIKINNNARMIHKKQTEFKDLADKRASVSKTDHRLFIGLFNYDFSGNREKLLIKIKEIYKEEEVKSAELDLNRYFINHLSLSDEIFLIFFLIHMATFNIPVG